MASLQRFYKEYPCEKCQDIFIKKSALKKHEEAEHPIIIERFSCDPCDQQFFWKKYYDEHLASPGHLALMATENMIKSSEPNDDDNDSQDSIQIINVEIDPLDYEIEEEIQILNEDNDALNCEIEDEIVDIEDVNNNPEPADINADLQVLGLYDLASFEEQSPDSSPQILKIKGLSSPATAEIICSICSQVFHGTKIPTKHWDNHQMMKKRRKYKDIYIYKCPTCINMYKLQSSLHRHIKVAHENYRPFPCNLCASGFYEQRALKSHLRTKHEKQPTREEPEPTLERRPKVLEEVPRPKIGRPKKKEDLPRPKLGRGRPKNKKGQ